MARPTQRGGGVGQPVRWVRARLAVRADKGSHVLGLPTAGALDHLLDVGVPLDVRRGQRTGRGPGARDDRLQHGQPRHQARLVPGQGEGGVPAEVGADDRRRLHVEPAQQHRDVPSSGADVVAAVRRGRRTLAALVDDDDAVPLGQPGHDRPPGRRRLRVPVQQDDRRALPRHGVRERHRRRAARGAGDDQQEDEQQRARVVGVPGQLPRSQPRW